MSVFSDFQRMWVQRFPQSSLSDAWEQDVRASLQRHKEKIQDLKKELEQENLYVEYLECLLNDVEKFRESGGDPSSVFDSANPPSVSGNNNNNTPTTAISSQSSSSHLTKDEKPNYTTNNNATPNMNHNDDNETSSDIEINKDVVLREHKDDETPSRISSLKNDSKSSQSTTKTNGLKDNLQTDQDNKQNGKTTSTTTTNDNNNNNNNKNKNTADEELKLKEVALNQCINELSTNLRRCISETPQSSSPSATSSATDLYNRKFNNKIQQEMVNEQNRRNSQNNDALESPSHFVTVIEVKETNNNNINKINNSGNNNNNSFSFNNNNNKSEISDDKSISEDDCEKDIDKKIQHHQHHQQQQHYPQKPTAPPASSVLLDAKRKVPPRPPPKYIRRAAPIDPPTVPQTSNFNQGQSTTIVSSRTTSTTTTIDAANHHQSSESNSLERNIKPSEILRQKSSDSLDPKISAAHRKTTPDLSGGGGGGNLTATSKFTKSIELADEFGRKLQKSDSLEKNRYLPEAAIKRTQSPTGSIGKSTGSNSSPTGSLGKFSNNSNVGGGGGMSDSPTGSLGKVKDPGEEIEQTLQSVGSKESLASQGVSERMKSYESISSLSSDSIKIGPGSGNNTLDHEPYYDTVPLDNGDGEYVYIQAGGNGLTAHTSATTTTMMMSSNRDDLSNAGSTLPLTGIHGNVNRNFPYNSQNSVLQEPESPGRSSNYVNIDYFLSQSNEARSSSIDSDGEGDTPALMRAISHDEPPLTPSGIRTSMGSNFGGSINNNNNNNTSISGGNVKHSSIRHIITSIINSETLYVECLNKMMQYMKAIRATLTTSQPVISEEEFQTMFFKIDELHFVHTKFLNDLKDKAAQRQDSGGGGGGDIFVGECIKELVGHIYLYGAFLHNYGRAIETVKKCGANNQQFKEIVSKIILNSQNEQSLTLEDLLHKPVARVQKNALVLQDLINETPQNHPDYQPLKHSQKIMRNFLSEFNVVQIKNIFPSEDKALRRLVKNSFIVELADGHRKLRHLFLFNDVIACAKYKASGRDRFEFELKWFIPLKDICIYEESAVDPKENSPINILQLKSQACTVRDQILLEDKDDKKQRSYGLRAGDKHRKKLHDLEAQLVLASPNLVFRIGNKSTGKPMTFFLSSDFERTQWIDSIMTLQQSCNLPGAQQVSIYDLQAWIAACQTLIKTEMGSYLLRNSRDESLLVGDLHLTIQGLTGLEHPSDFYICVEIDSYGHYFRKAKTKLICRSVSPLWNEAFILELEGSQNVRLLLYEDHSPRPLLRAKHILKLSRQWLQESSINKALKLNDTTTLNIMLRFVPGEVSLRRVPTSKPGALFGAKMQQVLKREKRDIPFIISACIREVERRGMCEVGVYRVSGSASDLAKLKKSFETNNYEAEQLLKDVDIHSVTGILKSYLRELPEALFTDLLYPKLVETFNKHSINFIDSLRTDELLRNFQELPDSNRATINYILDHLIRVNQQEGENKMSLHNLAMVFGPTLLRPGPHSAKQKDLLESSTVDVMAQAGILHCFLQAKSSNK